MRNIGLLVCACALVASQAFAQNGSGVTTNSTLRVTIATDDGVATDINDSAANLSQIATDISTIKNSLVPVGTHDQTALTTGDQVLGYASTATPTAVSTDGDAARVWVDLVGRLHNVFEVKEDTASADGDYLARIGCIRDDTLDARSGTEGDYEQCHLDANGALWSHPLSLGIEDVAETAGGSLDMAGTVRRDTAASSAGSSGDNATLNTDANGYLWTRTADPCTGQNVTTVPVSSTADVALISASASKKNIICGGTLVAGAAEIISIWEGTGTACGTNSAAVAGSTTEANGMSFAANGGFIAVSRIGGLSTNVDTCLRISGSNRISGYITYVQQ